MKQWFDNFISHTLKTKDGRWSRMSIIIATAWLMVIFMALWDFFCEGFRLDVWMTLVGVAVGTKWVDKKSESITPKSNGDTP